jgi:hypothetical protein
MSLDALRRLERDIVRQGGDKALRDANLAIVRSMIDSHDTAADSTQWWATYGPESGKEWRPGHPLPPQRRALVDCIVNQGPSPVDLVASHLRLDAASLRRLVSYTDTDLSDRGGKATISISGGMIHTTSIIVSSNSRPTN